MINTDSARAIGELFPSSYYSQSSTTLALPPNVVDGMQPYRDCCWAGGDKEKTRPKIYADPINP